MEHEKKDFQAKIVTFTEVYDLSQKISRQITDSSISFDVVVGIARGGVTPARLFCDFLNVDTLTSLQIRHYTSGAQQLEDVKITDPVGVNIRDKNVLLVDDVNDSGKTLSAATDQIKSLEPALLKSAVIHEKENTQIKADFVGEYLKEWKWLIYQWAVTEDILEFLNKDDMLDVPEEKALNHLRKKYKLTIDPDLYQHILEMKNNYL
ncbi:MAG: phosphoribosyltransferase [Balneolaceae bacterium]|nr:phosphoribosyltransferase [Balneolaceae bacterium]